MKFFNKKNKECKHKWEDVAPIVIADKYVRMVAHCRLCGLCVHRKIHPVSKLNEIE